jgi:tRNA (guanine37-N1)-methyltransferase
MRRAAGSAGCAARFRLKAGAASAVRFDILTLFPEFFDGPLRTSLLGRARTAGLIDCHVHNIRDWATDKHHVTDDAPYGGGGGMVMLAEVLLKCVREVREQAAGEIKSEIRNPKSETSSNDRISETDNRESQDRGPNSQPDDSNPKSTIPHSAFRIPHLIYLSPQGEPLTRRVVCELAEAPGLMLLCGAYEGIDERVAEMEVDREISIGDYVLTSGEPAALVLINAVARRLEGVVGNPESVPNDSFEGGVLDFPHYTRPETVEGRAVPPVLLSGHHAKIDEWRRRQQLERTARRRPDLLAGAELTEADREYLRGLGLWSESG